MKPDYFSKKERGRESPGGGSGRIVPLERGKTTVGERDTIREKKVLHKQ